MILPRAPSSVREARRLAVALRGYVPYPAVDDLRLVLSELLSNAVLHGDGETVEVRVQVEDGVVRGEVVDGGDGFAHPEAPAADATSGRGLAIVDALTWRWGIEKGSTHVWFELGAGG
jgi:anti-sigma regulatory factor (Ser/Thr protein kinase)